MTKQRKRTLLIGAACAAGVLVVLVGGYMTLVSPKQSKAASLRSEVADTQSKLSAALAAAHHPNRSSQSDAPDAFRLSKAMPDSVDIAGAILDLNTTARRTGIVLDGLTPAQPAEATNGYQSVPIQVMLHGRYGQFTNFLGALKQLVVVRDGNVKARGRLFGVDSIQFAAGTDGFPQLTATLQLQAYTYSPAAATPPSSSQTTTTPDTSASVSAAGATN